MQQATDTPLHQLQRGMMRLIRLRPRSLPVVGTLEWAPSANFIVHDENTSTMIGFSPLTTTRAITGSFFWEFRLFDKSPTEPIYTYKSDRMRFSDQETLDSAQIARRANLPKLFHYCELMAYSPDASPTGVSSVLVAFHHFTSRDGSFEAHLPAAYIWGAARFTRTERFHYENFPAARISATHRPVIITMNPFVRPMNYWIQLVDANGHKHEEGPFRVCGKGVSRWDGHEVTALGLTNPVGVIVRSEHKCNSFVGAVDTHTGHMVNLEHMHPFFSR